MSEVYPENFVASWTVDRGRSVELDKTSTGTATISINDVGGLLDPTNSSSPYYGTIEPLKQMALALTNPVTLATTTQFRGYVEDYDYVLDPGADVMRLDISLVDAMDILAAAEMMPYDGGGGLAEWGDGALATDPGVIHFDADPTGPDARINQLLDQADWPSALRSIYSGNVKLKATNYSPGTDVLSAIQDAADAEFPGVSNFYISKTGLATFRGRLARFNPSDPSYDIATWRCGDGAAVDASPSNTAHIRELGFSRGKSHIINSASASPEGISDSALAGQVVKDTASIATYGIRSWTAENLITDGGIGSGTTDLEETKLFADYYVANYAAPQNRISQVTFRSMDPDRTGAAANWALICGVEIGDELIVTTTHPGGGGFAAEEYFVEGIHLDVQPLNPSYHDVTLTLDVSPQAYWYTNPF
jgi:hypothetical protein